MTVILKASQDRQYWTDILNNMPDSVDLTQLHSELSQMPISGRLWVADAVYLTVTDTWSNGHGTKCPADSASIGLSEIYNLEKYKGVSWWNGFIELLRVMTYPEKRGSNRNFIISTVPFNWLAMFKLNRTSHIHCDVEEQLASMDTPRLKEVMMACLRGKILAFSTLSNLDQATYTQHCPEFSMVEKAINAELAKSIRIIIDNCKTPDELTSLNIEHTSVNIRHYNNHMDTLLIEQVESSRKVLYEKYPLLPIPNNNQD